jgi:hypothetical protein
MNNGLLKFLRCLIHSRWQVCTSAFRDCSQAKTTFSVVAARFGEPALPLGSALCLVSPQQLLLVLVGTFVTQVALRSLHNPTSTVSINGSFLARFAAGFVGMSRLSPLCPLYGRAHSTYLTYRLEVDSYLAWVRIMIQFGGEDVSIPRFYFCAIRSINFSSRCSSVFNSASVGRWSL